MICLPTSRTHRDRAGCLLLVHTEIERLEAAAEDIIRTTGWPRLSVGRELSAVLLPEPVRARPRAARTWLDSALASLAPGPVVCSEIDLLFEPSLGLDPLLLFSGLCRRARLLVLWPGSYAGETLAYATPDHAHYREWRRPEVAIRCL